VLVADTSWSERCDRQGGATRTTVQAAVAQAGQCRLRGLQHHVTSGSPCLFAVLISVLELIVRVAASSMFSIQKHFLYPLIRHASNLRLESTDHAHQIWYLPRYMMDVGEEGRHIPIPT